MAKNIPNIKGLTKSIAESQLQIAGFKSRVSREDAKTFIFPMIFVQDMVSLQIDNGIVTDYKLI